MMLLDQVAANTPQPRGRRLEQAVNGQVRLPQSYREDLRPIPIPSESPFGLTGAAAAMGRQRVVCAVGTPHWPA